MWTGSGPREKRVKVEFGGKFKGAPVVQAHISVWDLDRRTNLRADLSVADVTATGCTIVFKTWGDTRIARIRALAAHTAGRDETLVHEFMELFTT